MSIKQENRDFEPTEYTMSSNMLDDLLGPLELALSHSDHKIQLDYMSAVEKAKNPYYEVEEVTCEHCKKDFPSSTRFFQTHLPDCELSNKRINVPKIPNKTKLGCPICKEAMSRDKLMSHFHHEGPLKCQEYWRTFTVVEKKFAYPFYDTDRYENCLFEIQNKEARYVRTNGDSAIQVPALESSLSTPNPEDLCDSKLDVSEHLGYCPNCGVSVVNQEWFFDCHLLSCVEKAMREGTLSSFNPLTGLCIRFN